jgi:CubicO group peptidase (beta-lactamase class C family)
MDDDKLQRALQAVATRVGLRGWSAGLSDRGRLAWSMAAGPADRSGRAVTTSTLFQLASLTKPIAAVLVMRLVERGALDLDRPAAEFLARQRSPHRDMARSSPAITVRHLLTHTSAIPGLALGRRRPAGEPGARYQYSGAAFRLLTDVIETAGGAGFADQLTAEIIEPCGLTETYAGTAAAEAAGVGNRLAAPLGRKGFIGRLDTPKAIANAAAGLVSTVADYLKFDAALASGSFVADGTRAEMWSAATLADGKRSPYGLGFFVQTVGTQRTVWHYGYQPGYHSSLYIDLPDHGLAFVALANTDALGRDGKLGAGDLTRSSTAQAVLEALR